MRPHLVPPFANLWSRLTTLTQTPVLFPKSPQTPCTAGYCKSFYPLVVSECHYSHGVNYGEGGENMFYHRFIYNAINVIIALMFPVKKMLKLDITSSQHLGL